MPVLGLSRLALSVLALSPAQGQDDYQRAFEEVRKLAPRPDRVATVAGLVLRRDAAEFRLAEGTLALLTPVSGRTVGAVFVGRGAVSLRPPLAVERAHLLRVLKDSVVEGSIGAAVLLFADSTLAELERRVTFGPGTVPSAAAGAAPPPATGPPSRCCSGPPTGWPRRSTRSRSSASPSSAATTLRTRSKACSGSPGLMRSGLAVNCCSVASLANM